MSSLESVLRATILILTVIVASGSVGCGGDDSSGEKIAASTVEAQTALGKKLYGQHCARCHGAGGEGSTSAPPLVGAGALPLDPPATAKVRSSQFRTALDVGAFANEKMPGDAPGSLAGDEYLAILAFALEANGVALDQPVTLESATKIVLHP